MFDINLARNEYCRAIYVDFEIKNRFVNKNGETKYPVLFSPSSQQRVSMII